MLLNNIALLATIAFCLNSCGPGISDYIKELGNGYYFADINAYDKTIYYQKGEDGKVVVDNLVVSYFRMGDLIVALRQPRNTNISNNQVMFEKRCEYWIVDTSANKSIGPLEKKEYEEKVKLLGIPSGALGNPTSSGVPRHCLGH